MLSKSYIDDDSSDQQVRQIALVYRVARITLLYMYFAQCALNQI